MRKILIIGNKPIQQTEENRQKYLKVSQFINNEMDIVVRYNNCNNFNMLRCKTNFLFLNFSLQFINTYSKQSFLNKIPLYGLQQIFFSNRDEYHQYDWSKNILGIPSNLIENRKTFDYYDKYGDIIDTKKIRFTIYLRTIAIITSYIINNYPNDQIYLYGVDLDNRNLDIWSHFGYLHQYSDILEILYFKTKLKEKKLLLFKDLLKNL